jgi:cobalt-zinc-cadmium efflux system membrane fusion protein
MNRLIQLLAIVCALALCTAGCAEKSKDEAGHAHGKEAPGHEHGGEADHHDDHRIAMSADALKNNRVVISAAGSQIVRREIELPGEIILDADRVAHVVPRFPGIALKINKSLGDRVRAGEVLAVVQSNVSAAPYDITALINGTVVEKHVTQGEYVRDDGDIFVVADLSHVWVNISVYARFLSMVKEGQRVRITSTGIPDEAEGRIDYVGPIIGESTRTGIARVVLANPRGTWQPGLFVEAHVATDEAKVDVAVPETAIQSVEGRDVVFVRQADGFEVRRIGTGRRGGGLVEVTSGLAAGEWFVADGSFIFKAELGKSEAAHEH